MISLKNQTEICGVKTIYTYEERLTWTCGRKLTLIYKTKGKKPTKITAGYFSQDYRKGWSRGRRKEKQENTTARTLPPTATATA